MRYHIAVLLLAASEAVSETTKIQQTLEVPEGYTVVPMVWKGAVEKGGAEMTFNGTIQEVTRQIQAIRPNFTWEGLRRDIGKIEDRSTTPRRGKDNLICGVGGNPAVSRGPLKSHVEWQRDYLLGLTGVCATPAGPRTCTRISCSEEAGVWLCNDNATGIEPRCRYLGTYVQDIMDGCTYRHRGQTTVRGQKFDTDKYNIMVGFEWC